MTANLLVALLGLGLAAPQEVPVGTVRDVDIASNENGTVTFRIAGENPCGALHFIYGDGDAVTHPIVDLPTTITYSYPRTGDYEVVVQGMGNCTGEVTLRVQTTVPPEIARARAEAERAEQERQERREARARDGESDSEPAGHADIRFAEMDADGDGRISRDEWSGSSISFPAHDWNGDGVLAGAELQMFGDLDRDGNGRVTAFEWEDDAETFRQVDRNRDRVVSRAEFDATGSAAPEPDESPGGITTELRVPADVAWRDTGLFVRAGQVVAIDATGEIQWAGDASGRADPEGSLSGERTEGAPLPYVLGGALIARVGASEPFPAIESDGRVRMPRSGRLFLGINDDNVSDNQGAFEVTIQSAR